MNPRHRHFGLVLFLVVALPSTGQGDIVRFSEFSAKVTPVIVAGDPNGAPTDSPTNRIDFNTTISDFAGVGSVFADLAGPGGAIGTGTPITPFHILTAAHVIDSDGDGVSDVSPGDVTFILNFGSDFSHLITASALTIHPDFTGFANPSVNDDLAIITLSSALPALVPIYPLLATPLPLGSTLTLVGYGSSGDGTTAGYTVDPAFEVKRVGQNRADAFEVDDEAPMVANEVFLYDFDNPVMGVGINFLGGDDSLGNDVETTVGPGDSGGPAFYDDGGILKLAGVNTFSAEFLISTDPDVFGPASPLFDSGGGGILVHPHLSWIASVTAVPETGALMSMGAVALGSGALCWLRSRLQPRSVSHG